MGAATTWLNATLAGTAGGTSLITDLGLNNGTGPGTTGANELSGGSYARQAVTWTTPASGSTGNSASMSWSIAASTTGIDWASGWSASTSGTYETDMPFSSSVSFSSAGTLTAASGAITLSASQSA